MLEELTKQSLNPRHTGHIADYFLNSRLVKRDSVFHVGSDHFFGLDDELEALSEFLEAF